MIAIKCTNGRTILGINEEHLDAETKLNISYYKAQGCIVEKVKFVDFSDFSEPHDCEHCNSLEHEFESLIEEIKAE